MRNLARVIFAVVALVTSLLLTRFVSDFSGSALWSRVIFQVFHEHQMKTKRLPKW